MSVRCFVHAIGIFVRAQLITGIVIGLALRLAMRIVALTDDNPGTDLTAGGTTAIFMVATIFGAVPSLLFVVLRRFLPGSARRQGLIFGAVMLPIGGMLVVPEALSTGIPWLNIPMFAAVLVLYGLVFSVTVARLDRRTGRRQPRTGSALGSAPELPASPSGAIRSPSGS